MNIDISCFTPGKDKVLLIVEEESEKELGIIIPLAIRGKQKPYEFGRIAALGPEACKFVAELKIGQRVIVPKHGHEVWKQGGDRVVISIVGSRRIEAICD